MYDFLIVGTGLFGATFAHQAKQKGKSVLLLESREHIGGNIYTREVNGIQVHQYGAHIFHTSNEKVWKFINQFAEFNNYINTPIARYKEETYNLPFNMNTFAKMWGIATPKEAQEIIQAQIAKAGISNPSNLEEQAISMVGTDIYEKLIKGYTTKQWGRDPKDLPSFIIKRLPLRFTYDNNYFNDRYQGIPIGGYTPIIEKMIAGCEVRLSTDYLSAPRHFDGLAKQTLYTGPIDALFNYSLGQLEYRGLHFETEELLEENFQGNAVVNYTEAEVPYTRIIEHKHFEFTKTPNTIISKEFPAEWKLGKERYYPVNDTKNSELYKQYRSLAKEKQLLLGGRLAEYKYYDMHQVIHSALNLSEIVLANEN